MIHLGFTYDYLSVVCTGAFGVQIRVLKTPYSHMGTAVRAVQAMPEQPLQLDRTPLLVIHDFRQG